MAKPTVHNHLNDKATLFQQAMQAAARTVLDERLTALEPVKDPRDLRAILEDVGHRLLKLHTDDRSCALRRLLHAEIAQFPDIIDIDLENGPHRLTQALADRLARLTLAGRLRATAPDQAAEQFMALLTGPLEARTRLGTRQIDDAEMHEITNTAVRTFFHAFGTADAC